MRRDRRQNIAPKKDVTLMTVIAHDETSNIPARKLLRRYGKPDCKNPNELEESLAQLYFSTDDKLALEKELAAIHPHKKWLLDRVTPMVIETVGPVIEEVPAKSGCGCGGNCGSKVSSFDGTGAQKPIEVQSKSNTLEQYAGIIGLVAVVGISFYVISKNHKSA